MTSVQRFKFGLLLCLATSMFFAMTLSSGWQRVRESIPLTGVRSAPDDTPAAKPAATAPPTPAPTPTPKRSVTPTCPIHWTPAVQLRDLSELDHPEPLLNRPLALPSPADKLTMIAPASPAPVTRSRPAGGNQPASAVVRTLADYLRLKQQGYSAKTDADAALESLAKAQVYPLLFLRRAVPARQSFVTNFDIAANPLTDLPPTLGPAPTAAEAQRIQRLAAQGATWKKAFPSAKAAAVAGDKYAVRITDKDFETRLTLLAWGDFNNDGAEDLLVSVVTTARNGSARGYRIAVLTRLQKNGPLTVVDVRD